MSAGAPAAPASGGAPPAASASGGASVLAGIVGPLSGLRAYFARNAVLLAAGLGLWLLSTRRGARGSA